MKFLKALIVAVLLSGCATTGKAPSFNALLEAAYSADDGLIVTGDNLLQTHVISVAQAKRLLNIADQMKQALDAANAVYQAGNAALAMSELQAASGALSTAQDCANAS